MRAISLRTSRSRPWLSSWPVAAWKRRLNSSILASASLPSSSSSVMPRRSAAARPFAITHHRPLASRTSPSVGTAWGACASLTSRVAHLALNELALHWELVHRATQRFPGHRLGDAGQLEHHPARLHVGHPPLGGAFAGAHPGLGRLLGQRPVRVDRDPHLPAAADVPGHGDTGGLDLPVRHVRVLDGLDAVLAERHPGAALGRAVPVRPVLLAVLDPPRDEHVSALLARAGAGGSSTRRAGRNRRLLPAVGAVTAAGPGPVGTARAALAAGTPAPAALLRATPVPVPAGALAGPQRGGSGLALGPGLRGLAAVDPHLHADPAKRGPRLVEAVVDVGAQRVQRHPALAVELGARHFGAAKPTRALHPDPLGAALHRGLHGLAHGPAERDPAGELLGHALGDQLRVDLGVLDLEDVQLDLLAGQLLQVAADPVGLGAPAADHDAGTRGVDVHPDPVPGPLDLYLRDAGPLHAALQHPADSDVFRDVVLVQLVGVPPALEVGGDAEPEPVRVHFLAH